MSDYLPGLHTGAQLIVELRPEVFAPMREITASHGLQEAIARSHLYMIITRPQIRARRSVHPLLGPVIEFTSQAAEHFGIVKLTRTEMVASTDIAMRMPAVHPSAMTVDNTGRRITIPIGNSRALHVSAHVAAALTSHDDPETFDLVTKWQISYIGMSYRSGEGSLVDRLIRHEILQPILDTYLSIGWEVNVVPITVAETWASSVACEYPGPDPDLDLIQQLASLDGRRESQSLVGLLENALIAYFQPEHNTQLKHWPGRSCIDALSRAGVTEVQIEFNAYGDLYRLFSPRRPVASRGFWFTSRLRGPCDQQQTQDATIRDDFDSILAAVARARVATSNTSAPTMRYFEDQVFAV